MISQIASLTGSQRRTLMACFFGWTLDAFDFFLLTFCLDSIATTYGRNREEAATAIFWTLLMRPVGAIVYGALAERIGRKPSLIVNVISYTGFTVASALAPSFAVFLVTRALFGIAMGGEWGVGSALALESLPAKGRGFFSGILQEGYAAGSLLAALIYFVFPHLHPWAGLVPWRELFLMGTVPALLLLPVLLRVDESPVWLATRNAVKARSAGFGEWLRYLPSLLFLTLMMAAFMSFSHGTQDLYPQFVKHDHHLKPGLTLTAVTACGSLGAIFGGLTFGTLSERWGRRRSIITAALLALPMIPLWAYSQTAVLLAAGAFLMQFAVQGAWGVIPAHLNELSPPAVRAVFPGLAYQLGNVISSRNSVLQEKASALYAHGQYAPVLAWTVVIAAALVVIVSALGREAKGAAFEAAE